MRILQGFLGVRFKVFRVNAHCRDDVSFFFFYGGFSFKTSESTAFSLGTGRGKNHCAQIDIICVVFDFELSSWLKRRAAISRCGMQIKKKKKITEKFITGKENIEQLNKYITDCKISLFFTYFK